MIDNLKEEYEREERRIGDNRSLAWSSASLCMRCESITLQPMTVQSWIDLQASANAMLTGETPTTEDLFAYIWRHQSGYTVKPNLKASLRKWKLKRRIRKTNTLLLLQAVINHTSQAFDEVPETASDCGYNRTTSFSGYDQITSAIDEVASRYSQSPVEVLSWPLSRFFLLQKSIRVATIEGYKPLAPASIRRASSRILEALKNG